MILAGKHAALQANRGAGDLDHAAVARAVELGRVCNRHQPLGLQQQTGIGLDDDRATASERSAQVYRIAGIELDRMARRLRADRHVADIDAVAGIDLHRSHQADRTMQPDVMAGVDQQLVVVTRRGGSLAAHDSGDIDVLAGQHDRAAAFEPARGILGAGQDAEVALERADLQQRQSRGRLAYRVADQHIVDA